MQSNQPSPNMLDAGGDHRAIDPYAMTRAMGRLITRPLAPYTTTAGAVLGGAPGAFLGAGLAALPQYMGLISDGVGMWRPEYQNHMMLKIGEVMASRQLQANAMMQYAPQMPAFDK